MKSKIITDTSHLKELLKELRVQNCKIVFTNGCFDLLHPGHVTYLREAKALGDVLIVGVNSDESIKTIKGPKRPINVLEARMTVLAALESVDFIIPFTEATPIELIKKVQPDFHVKGGDYKPEDLPERPAVQEYAGETVIVQLLPGYSTTSLINVIVKRYGTL